MKFFDQAPKVIVNPGATAGPWYIDMRALHHWDAIASWTGTLAGTWKIEAGGGLDGGDHIATTPGTWVDVTSRATPSPVNPAGSAGSTELSGVFWTANWARLSLTGITGAGTLTVVLTGKE